MDGHLLTVGTVSDLLPLRQTMAPTNPSLNDDPWDYVNILKTEISLLLQDVFTDNPSLRARYDT